MNKPEMSREEICQTIINQKSIHSGLFGAVTGIGGLAVPIALPANLYTLGLTRTASRFER